jgi:hypothetical protein
MSRRSWGDARAIAGLGALHPAMQSNARTSQSPNAQNSIAEYGSLRAKNRRVVRTKTAMACSHVYP